MNLPPERRTPGPRPISRQWPDRLSSVWSSSHIGFNMRGKYQETTLNWGPGRFQDTSAMTLMGGLAPKSLSCSVLLGYGWKKTSGP